MELRSGDALAVFFEAPAATAMGSFFGLFRAASKDADSLDARGYESRPENDSAHHIYFVVNTGNGSLATVLGLQGR